MENQPISTTLNEIRSLMERSTRFLSLSALSFVLVGIYACISAYTVYHLYGGQHSGPILQINTPSRLYTTIGIALLLLTLSLATVFLLSYGKAKKESAHVHLDQTTRRLLWHFFFPLIIGGLLCLSLIYHLHYGLTSSIMLIFYGLSVVNCSKYTYSNIQYLGYAEILLGVLDSFFQGHALLFWTIGFGLFHILYGIYFYLCIERKKRVVNAKEKKEITTSKEK